MPSPFVLLGLAISIACAAWLFYVLPRLRGHMDPWEHEYEAAFRAYKERDLATAERHIRTAYDLACRQSSDEARRETQELLARIRDSLN